MFTLCAPRLYGTRPQFIDYFQPNVPLKRTTFIADNKCAYFMQRCPSGIVVGIYFRTLGQKLFHKCHVALINRRMIMGMSVYILIVLRQA